MVYGSRFLDAGKRGTFMFYLANRGLAGLTNVLYRAQLTDIETCYKVLRRDVLDQLTLRAARFGDRARADRAGAQAAASWLVELPIGYHPRSRAEGQEDHVARRLRRRLHAGQSAITKIALTAITKPRLYYASE